VICGFVRHVVTALRHIWRKCCDNFTPPWAKFFYWQISHAYFCFLFQRFVSHVNTLKLNWNKTFSLKQNIVLRFFCFSFVSVLFQS